MRILTGILISAAALFAQQETGDKIDPDLQAQLRQGPAAFFVVMKDRGLVQAASQIADRAARAQSVVQTLTATAANSQAAVRAMLRARGVPFTPFWIANMIYVPNGDLALAEAIAQRSEVEAIRREPVMSIPRVAAVASTTAQAPEWNIARIRADQAWTQTQGGGVVAAAIDTGVRYTHQALVNQYRGNTGTGFTHTGNWKDTTGVCGAAPCDNSDHGTHVLGIMVGSDGGTNQIGVAPQATWIACKGCTNSSTCYGSHLMACAQWVLDPYAAGTGAGHADVVNNSWSGAPGDAWFMEFVDNWRAAGIFPAFAAGNTGPACGTAGSPGDYPAAFSAGATDSTDTAAGFSSRGPSAIAGFKPNVAAPGVVVRSSIATGDAAYASFSGTSMASPHVVGAVALLWAAQPALRGNVALSAKVLQDTAVPLATSEACGGTASQVPNNTYGSGLLDALAAVSANPEPNISPAVAVSSPVSGSNVVCPATVQLSAAASDPEDGDLSALVSWFDNGVTLAAGQASRSYSCTEMGLHNLTAAAADSGGLMGFDTVTLQVLACLPKGTACSANSQCCSKKCSKKVCR